MAIERKSARDLITELLGTRTRAVDNPEISEVGTSALELLKQNPNRIAFLLVNLSGATIYLYHDNEVSSTRGITLGPSGGYASFIWNEDYEWVSRSWFVVADSSSSNLVVTEQVTD